MGVKSEILGSSFLALVSASNYSTLSLQIDSF